MPSEATKLGVGNRGGTCLECLEVVGEMNRGRNGQGQRQWLPSGCHFRYYKLAGKRRVKEEKEERVHMHYYRIGFYYCPITAGF